MAGFWRGLARPLITKTIKDNPQANLKEMRKALREAYPFGPLMYYPYKVWCDEVRKQLGLHYSDDPKQMSIFDKEETHRW